MRHCRTAWGAAVHAAKYAFCAESRTTNILAVLGGAAVVVFIFAPNLGVASYWDKEAFDCPYRAVFADAQT
jgi:hypothetical protein